MFELWGRAVVTVATLINNAELMPFGGLILDGLRAREEKAAYPRLPHLYKNYYISMGYMEILAPRAGLP
jgi:hypothetical protein